MRVNGCEICAKPFITGAHCKECGKSLIQVSDGWFSTAMYCSKCEDVYMLKLIKVPAEQINNDFIDQCREESQKGKRQNE